MKPPAIVNHQASCTKNEHISITATWNHFLTRIRNEMRPGGITAYSLLSRNSLRDMTITTRHIKNHTKNAARMMIARNMTTAALSERAKELMI